MIPYLQIAGGIDVVPLALELQRQPWLWDRNDIRLDKRGPHSQTHDIWLRYKDETENKESGNWKDFADLHDAVWYPAFYALPSARKIIFDLMARVQGERLGGIFIYKVPPGCQIERHTDPGWHAAYYDKFNVCITSNPHAAFCYEGDQFVQRPGDVHQFVNTVDHWIRNDGLTDHIVMIVCIKCHDYRARQKGEDIYAMPVVDKLVEVQETIEFEPRHSSILGGLYRRIVELKAGQMLGQHVHQFDHFTMITGHVRCWRDGAWLGDFKSANGLPYRLEIKAQVQHAFQALEDSKIVCEWPEDIAEKEPSFNLPRKEKV